MKKVIFSQILAGNGVTNFSGLFDEMACRCVWNWRKMRTASSLPFCAENYRRTNSRKSAWIMNTARIVRCGNNAMRSVMKYDP